MICDVYIASTDKALLRMIELELKLNGYRVATGYKISATQKATIAVIDFDTVSTGTLNGYKGCIYITATNNDITTESYKKHIATKVLHRPFLLSELRDSVKAILCDTQKSTCTIKKQIVGNYETNEISIDVHECIAVFNGKDIKLSYNEAVLLDLLIKQKHKPVSRKQICELYNNCSSNMADVYICHLRKRLELNTGIKLIYTVRNVGYSLKCPSASKS